MKKSKIIGLNLGFSALAAVAISTPFVITACSESSTTNNEISAKISNTFATGKASNESNSVSTSTTNITIEPSNENNSINIYTGVTTVTSYSRADDTVQNTFVKLTLKTTLKDIISAEDIKNAGLTENVTVAWEFENVNWTLVNNELSNKVALKNDETITLKLLLQM